MPTSALTILVVEDNLDAQKTLCDLLQILGYEAIGVDSGEAAIDKLALADALLTDLYLPGMSGMELANITHAIHPFMPIILSSGIDVPFRLDFDVHLLPKPFNIESLEEILSKIQAGVLQGKSV